MGEEFIKEEEYKEYKFKIYLLKEFDKHICSIYVMLKSDEYKLFTERTIITQEAKMIGKGIVKQQFPKIENPDKLLIKKLIEYTFKNTKERIDSKNFEKGRIYEKDIYIENIRQLFNEIKRKYL